MSKVLHQRDMQSGGDRVAPLSTSSLKPPRGRRSFLSRIDSTPESAPGRSVTGAVKGSTRFRLLVWAQPRRTWFGDAHLTLFGSNFGTVFDPQPAKDETFFPPFDAEKPKMKGVGQR